MTNLVSSPSSSSSSNPNFSGPPTPAPPLSLSGSRNSRIISWLERKLTEGEEFLKAQPNYDKIAPAIDAVMGTDLSLGMMSMSGPSHTRTNRVRKIFGDLTAMLTDIKPFWNYQTSNRSFEQHAGNFGKLATGWYQRRDADLTLAELLCYYAVSGTGYGHVYFDPDLQDMDMEAVDPRNVVPIAPTSYRTLEKCLGAIVKRWVPVSYIEERYKIIVKPDSNGEDSGWLRRASAAVSEIISPIHKFSNSDEKSREMPKIPGVWIKTCYIKDFTVNSPEHLGPDFTNAPIEMGEFTDGSTGRVPANNWSYIVPVGSPLYPRRRMIVWVGSNENGMIYDGPMIYWHGEEFFPIIKLTLDPVPFSWFGIAPLWDLLGLQMSLNRTLRAIDDHIDQVANPGAVMDKNNVSKAEYNKFDTRRAGWKIFQNPLAGKGIQIVNPPPMDASIPEHRDWIKKEMEELAGTVDFAPLMQLKQMPANSTVESIMNAMTPGLRKRSRVLEAFQRQFAMMLAYDFSQFYTLPMRVSILGPDGITMDDFDYEPGSLIPDYLDSDMTWDPENKKHSIKPELLNGPRPKYDRTREFLRMFVFQIQPGSLLNAAQMEQTLMYFQLMRAGVMDPITVMEKMNIPNIGVERLPPNCRTVLDRLLWCMQVGLVPMVSSVGRKASGQESPQEKPDGSGVSESG